jgi:hypothetical protein
MSVGGSINRLSASKNAYRLLLRTRKAATKSHRTKVVIRIRFVQPTMMLPERGGEIGGNRHGKGDGSEQRTCDVWGDLADDKGVPMQVLKRKYSPRERMITSKRTPKET